MYRRASMGGILFVIALFEVSAFTIIALNQEAFDIRALVVGFGAIGLLVFQYTALSAFFRNIDRQVLIIANFLAGVGLILQYRMDPDTAIRQLIWVCLGMFVMIAAIVVIRAINNIPKFRFVLALLSFALLAASVLFGTSKGGAKNWVFGFQPSEFVKIIMVFVLAAMLARAKRGIALLPAGLYVAICILLLLMQRDLGAALLYAGTALAMLYASTGSKLITGAALGAAAGGSVLAYKMFSHVRLRVALWQNPWADYEGSGFQVVQGLIAIASGGLFGMGLTKGMPGMIPMHQTDFVFAVMCEEFGLIFAIAIIAFYLLFIIRGAVIAMDARNSFDALVAIGCVSMITLQSFIIIGGVTKLIPLTGITLPFISYGGSSMLSCFMLVGVLEGVAVKNADADEVEFGDYLEEHYPEEYEDEAYDEDMEDDGYDGYADRNYRDDFSDLELDEDDDFDERY